MNTIGSRNSTTLPVRRGRSVAFAMHLPLGRYHSLPSEQRLEIGLRLVCRGLVARAICAVTRPEIIAEIRALLVLDFLGDRLATALRDGRVVELTHQADVQLGATGGALVCPPQRQRELRERRAALPAAQRVAHPGVPPSPRTGSGRRAGVRNQSALATTLGAAGSAS